LTVLSHPEMALYSAWTSFLFMLFFARNRTGLLHSVIVAAGVLILSAPWWLTEIGYHGFTPFVAAFMTGEQSLTLIFALLFTGFGFIEQSLLGVIALLGAVKRIAEGKYLLPVWLITLFIVDLRSAQTFAVVVVALLVAVALDEALLPMLRRTTSTSSQTTSLALPRRSSRAARAIFALLIFTWSLFTALSVPIPVLAKDERDAMTWVSQNIPPQSTFVIISGLTWYEDAVSEWFPIVANHNSLETVQGYEWLPHQAFQKQQEQHKDLQDCASEGLECLTKWSHDTGVKFSYIYISTERNKNSALQNALAASPDFTLVYNGPGAVIFQNRLADVETI
jgi:hypothetical protein